MSYYVTPLGYFRGLYSNNFIMCRGNKLHRMCGTKLQKNNRWKESLDRVSQRTETRLNQIRYNQNLAMGSKVPVMSRCARPSKKLLLLLIKICWHFRTVQQETQGTRGVDRAHEGREHRAGPAATRQSPWKHFWRADHGLDGERGYSCSQVC